MLRSLRTYIGCPDSKAVFKRFNYAVEGGRKEIVLIKILRKLFLESAT